MTARRASRDPRRVLPSVDRLARDVQELAPELPGWACREAAREALAEAREALGRSELPGDVAGRARELARAYAQPHPRRVVNATGVVLHTNLGRAPMAPGAARAAAEAAAAYTDLELDLASGSRGRRSEVSSRRLRWLSGAEDALAVNNGAGAVLLALATLARGREVVVSRGELVEIGGSFRVPEILAQAGVRLVEVGTTNRTHPRDYEAAVGPDTGVLLKVHRSNFEQRGFVAEVELAELVEIGRRRGVPVVEDLGSATLLDLRSHGFPEASYAPARLATGVDLLCFSGDKLLGGPQAGIALGRREVVGAMRESPLARALRLDAMSLAALDWTLTALQEGREEELPTVRQLRAPQAALRRSAEALAERLAAAAPAGLEVAAVDTEAPVGGGSLPGLALPGAAVALRGPQGARALAAALRRAPVPVVARVSDDRVLLELRALLPGDEDALEAALRAFPRS